MDPVLVLTILNPKISFADADVNRALDEESKILRHDGSQLDSCDLKRLQVST